MSADIASSIQLLPETRTDITVAVPGENRWLIYGIVLFAVVGLVYGALFTYARGFPDKISAVDQDFKKLDESRNGEAETQLLLLKDQLAVVGKVLDEHLIWSSLLAKMQNKTSPQVKYNLLAMAYADNILNIEGEAANYTVIAKQLSSYYAEESVADVRLNESSLMNNGHISFKMQVQFKPGDIQLKAIAQSQ